MAVLNLTDVEVLAGPFRLTGRSNAVDLEFTSPNLDVTTFDSGGWNEFIGGIQAAACSVDGFYDSATIETGSLVLDEQSFTEVAGTAQPLTVAPTKADGSVAYVTGYIRSQLEMLGAVGDVAGIGTDVAGEAPVGRGNLLHPANTTETAGGTGTGRQVGAASASQKVVIAVHVTALSGTSPDLDITVESDDAGGFASPTTVLNTGSITTPTGTITVVDGAVTDDWYRVTWTLTGTSPVARFAVAVGITP